MTRALLLLLLVLVGGSAYGQDDHPEQPAGAVALDAGGVGGRIEVAGDRDLFRLDAVAGREYVVETSSLSGGMDSLLDLYDINGQHMSRDDDGAGNLASRIRFRAPVGGAYWVMVTHYDRNAGTGGYLVSARALTPAPAPATPSAPAPSTPAAPPTATGGASLDFARVFDPKLSGATLDLEFGLASAGAIRLEIKDGAGRGVRRLVDAQRGAGRHLATWDGTDRSGLYAAPGNYTVELSSGGQRLASAPLALVRLGIRSLGFTGSGRIPLTYHDADGFGARVALDQIGPAWTLPASALGAGCLDASSGSPLQAPAPHAALAAPPRTSSGALRTRGVSLPVAYALGSRPQAQVQFGDSAASGGAPVACGYPIAGVPLRVAVEGGVAVDAMSGELRPGGTTTLDLPQSPSSVGKARVRYRFRFYYLSGSSWAPVPGGQVTEHTLYSSFGRPGADMPGRRPWVKALDLAVGWTSGQSTRRGAMTKVVESVNSRLGLRYDVNSGAPAYTGGWELHRPELDFDAFLDDLDNGRTVNCLDCASLVTKLAGQLGLTTNVAVLGWDFRLNYLRGIGWDRFTNRLFGGHHAFSYHAVATTDRGRTIDDACLSLDDDSRPWRTPFVERLPTGIDFDRYRQQLSPDLFRLRDLGTASLR